MTYVKKESTTETVKEKIEMDKILHDYFVGLQFHVQKIEKICRKFASYEDTKTTLEDVVDLYTSGKEIADILTYKMASYKYHKCGYPERDLKSTAGEWMIKQKYITKEKYLLYIYSIVRDIEKFKYFLRCVDKLNGANEAMIIQIFSWIETYEYWVSKALNNIKASIDKHDNNSDECLRECREVSE